MDTLIKTKPREHRLTVGVTVNPEHIENAHTAISNGQAKNVSDYFRRALDHYIETTNRETIP